MRHRSWSITWPGWLQRIGWWRGHSGLVGPSASSQTPMSCACCAVEPWRACAEKWKPCRQPPWGDSCRRGRGSAREQPASIGSWKSSPSSRGCPSQRRSSSATCCACGCATTRRASSTSWAPRGRLSGWAEGRSARTMVGWPCTVEIEPRCWPAPDKEMAGSGPMRRRMDRFVSTWPDAGRPSSGNCAEPWAMPQGTTTKPWTPCGTSSGRAR